MRLGPCRAVRLLSLALSAALGLGGGGQAASPAPSFVVDPQAPPWEDVDGDRTFRTLSAALDPRGTPHAGPYDVVLLAAGTHEGSWVLRVPGLRLRGEGEKTRLRGTLSLEAKYIVLESFQLEAAGQACGIAVRAPEAAIRRVGVRGARGPGIWLDAPRAQLEAVELAHNGGAGLEATLRADGLHLRASRLQANARHGALLRGTRAARLEDNVLALNRGSGARLEGVDAAVLRHNRFTGNGEHGVHLLDGADAQIRDNAFQGNGRFGLALEGGGGHRIVNNVLSANGGAGLASGGVLLWASDANALIDNRIARHSRLGAAGILLFGAAEANRLEGNVLTGNASGVRLLPDPTAARPAGNELVANRLENSQRLGLLSLGRRNSYRDNLIASNNGLGALLFESEGERFSGNVFRDNGKAGLEAVRVARLRLEGNRFEGNAAGTIATGLARSELRANVFEGNAGEAVNLLQGERLRFSENVVRGQGRDGFVMRATRALVLSGNAFSGNAPVDALLERVTEAEIFENAFAEGLALWEGAAFRLARNRLPAAGLWPWETAELDARANFWGGPAGPRRSLVLGPEVAFPWAPVPPEEIVPGTLVGWRAAELGDWVHVPGRGLALAPAEPAARGWLIGFVPAAASAPVTPAWRFALIGEAERTVQLRWTTAELPQATGLSLWSREAGGTWQSLELEADEDGLQAHLRLRPLVPTVIVLGVAG